MKPDSPLKVIQSSIYEGDLWLAEHVRQAIVLSTDAARYWDTEYADLDFLVEGL